MSNIKEKITQVVVDRTCDENVFPIVGLNMLQPLIQSMGIDLALNDQWETNGWECDWWWYFYYDDLPFVLSGGLFTSFITIALDQDKLDEKWGVE